MVEQSNKTDSIFWSALGIAVPEERGRYLDEACADDPNLRAQLDELLAAYPKVERFLEQPAFAADATAIHEPPITERPGTVIGPYKLLQQIGEGGMGVVFMAEQTEPLQRTVALKIIKPGMDTRQVIARFEAERQALAMMDHPNIAKVLDAGTTDTGRPYFVMELVKGVPITEYCDHCSLMTQERLELFVTSCRAVQHAHQKGVIHRDIKPTNVLVAIQDGQAAPKIIDFGVAKAINQRLTERTLLTGFAEMVGTPLYMSPEQAELSPLSVDTRSDIYSLGVLLYELLTGTTPFEKDRLHAAPYDELRRIIREEEPPRPSARISTLAADMATTLAEHRRTDPRRLLQSVRGDLDWIVMRCLEKDRGRRYETANDLALDVQRYLDNEPVLASPPSWITGLTKWAHRHRTASIAAGLLTLVVALGATVTTVLLANEQSATAQALNESEQKERALQVTNQELEKERKRAEENLRKAREAVDRMLTRVAAELEGQPHMEQIRRALLEDALEFYQGFLKQQGGDVTLQHETARAYYRVAQIHALLGRYTEVEEDLRHSAVLLKKLSAEFPSVPDYRFDLARAHERLGLLLARGSTMEGVDPARPHEMLALTFNWNRRQEAIAERRMELELREKLVADFPTVPHYRDSLAYCLSGLGNILQEEAEFPEAEKQLRRALVVLEKREADFRSLPPPHAFLAHAHHWLGNVLLKTNRLQEAEQHLRQSLALRERIAAEQPNSLNDQVDLAHIKAHMGILLYRMGKPDDAGQFYRPAITIMEKVVANHPSMHEYQWRLSNFYSDLADLLIGKGRVEEAEETLRRGVALRTTMLADFPDLTQDPAYLAWDHYKLGLLLHAADRTREAADHFRQAIDGFEKGAAAFPEVATRQFDLAQVLATCPASQFRNPEQAVKLAKKALQHDPLSTEYWYILGVAEYRAGNWDSAIESTNKAIEVRPGGGNSAHWFMLAMAHGRLGRNDEARQWYEKAVEWMKENRSDDKELGRFRAEAEELLKITYETPTTKPESN